MSDYLVIDEDGIKEVYCMNCGKKIRERRLVNGQPLLRTFANYALDSEIHLEENGKPHSVAHIPICKDCNASGIDLVRIMQQIKRGLELEMKHIEKKPKKDIDNHLKIYDKIKINKHVRRQ